MNPQKIRTDDEQRDTGWAPCPAGELSRFISGWKVAKQQKIAITRSIALVTMTAAVLLMAGLAWNGNPFGDTGHVQLACADVIAVDQQYVKKELTPEMQARVEQHLANCSECRNHMQIIRDSLDQPISAISNWSALLITTVLGHLD